MSAEQKEQEPRPNPNGNDNDNLNSETEHEERQGQEEEQASRQSSTRTPFTNLSQVDADLALARTLQEQVKTSILGVFRFPAQRPELQVRSEKTIRDLGLIGEGDRNCRWPEKVTEDDDQWSVSPPAATNKLGHGFNGGRRLKLEN
ncbi:hypothetical protein HRI_003183600 [Hibiscus trionum]|uniref:Uncharacterized protein n=1 Tax=Hibiscus trionum TaxID=183268 RepID=A0A9W7IGX5_HIBTR|nr:hypothetical protein HRI_003183600 [Hibiscus trionum]